MVREFDGLGAFTDLIRIFCCFISSKYKFQTLKLPKIILGRYIKWIIDRL